MRRLKTVRRPPIYPKTPGHLPYSLTHPLPLSSRRPSVSFGGFGLKRKNLEVSFKEDGPEGSITATFATLNVVDHDGDIIRKGAGDKKQVNLGLYNHVFASPTPAGVGDTYEKGNKLKMDGEYFLDLWAGEQTFRYLKHMKDRKRPVEWSFAYHVTEGGWIKRDGKKIYEIKAMDIISVDPVGRGAGINIQTDSVKDCDGACMANRAEAESEESTVGKAVVELTADSTGLREELDALEARIKAIHESTKDTAEDSAAADPPAEPETEATSTPSEDAPIESDPIFKDLDEIAARFAALQVPADPEWAALTKESEVIEARKSQLQEVK